MKKQENGNQNGLPKSQAAADFYIESLQILNRLKLPYMVGGTFAVSAYTGIDRETKDIDIFTKAGDYPGILHAFGEKGFTTKIADERWLAKIGRGPHFFDLIFNSGNSIVPVTDAWFKESKREKILGVEVSILPPTELLLSKIFGMDRLKYEGNDVAHVILKKGKELDWKRLLSYADQYWEVLLIHILNFRFIYPSEREKIPRWLLEELLARLESQKKLPTSEMKICRGRLLSRGDFAIDIQKWGFADIVGAQNEAQQAEARKEHAKKK
jgi:hypothetical protein